MSAQAGLIASLPMYDLPETRAGNDALWSAIRAVLGEGPQALCRGGDPWDHWQSPDLILSQTCGYPYRTRLHGRVTLIGAPVLDLAHLPAGYYSTVMVARRDDARRDLAQFAGARLAFNDPMSQSGWAAPQDHARIRGLRFGASIETGAHAASIRAVATGQADIAGIDILSWTLLQRHCDMARTLRVVEETPPTPALPYITAPGRDPERHFAAITAAFASLPAQVRATLGLRGIVRMPAAAYLAVPTPPPPAGARIDGAP